jgi:hypothetical protein
MDWLGAAKPCRAGPFQHANLDAVMPPKGTLYSGYRKVGPETSCAGPIVSQERFVGRGFSRDNKGEQNAGLSPCPQILVSDAQM